MTNTSSDRARREAALQRADIGAGFYNIVDGRRLAAAQTLDVIDPGTGAFLAKVPDVDRSDLDAAVDAAARAFPSWSRTPWDVRKAAVGRLIEALSEHVDELATLLAAEGGRSIGVAQWEIKWITDLYGSALLAMELTEERWVQERVGQVVKRYVPLGVVCAISPWNLPRVSANTLHGHRPEAGASRRRSAEPRRGQTHAADLAEGGHAARAGVGRCHPYGPRL